MTIIKKYVFYLIEIPGSLSVSDATWKYIAPNKGTVFMRLTRIEIGNALVDQLYNLQKDRGEKMSLVEKILGEGKSNKSYSEKSREV